MANALTLSLQDSLQVFLIDGQVYTPYSGSVQTGYDLAEGVENSQIFPNTIRFKNQEGGTLKWGDQGLFGDAWNPIGGSNWIYDQAAFQPPAVSALMYDPYTGLQWPLRAEKADLTVQKI